MITLESFIDEMLVVCPRCSGCARVAPVDQNKLFAPRKVTCGACGYSDTWEGQSITRRDGVDDYFELPLWIRSRCCGQLLWAYNWRHLDYIATYVGALQREDDGPGTLAAKLPRWLKGAHNREQVLACIEKLRTSRT